MSFFCSAVVASFFWLHVIVLTHICFCWPRQFVLPSNLLQAIFDQITHTTLEESSHLSSRMKQNKHKELTTPKLQLSENTKLGWQHTMWLCLTPSQATKDPGRYHRSKHKRRFDPLTDLPNASLQPVTSEHTLTRPRLHQTKFLRIWQKESQGLKSVSSAEDSGGAKSWKEKNSFTEQWKSLQT